MSNIFACWSLPGASDFTLLENTAGGTTLFVMASYDLDVRRTLSGSAIKIKTKDLQLPIADLSPCTLRQTTEAEHHDNIAEATRRISETNLDKVVLSTQNVIAYSGDLTPLLIHLRTSHPQAFVYACKHPDVGYWIGATPEPLITGHGRHFHTVSLAGTRVAELGVHPWGQKESLEQSIVTDYIRERLAESGATEVRIQRPETIRYGNLEHLRSEISFTSDDLDAVLTHLHPTPAVCGTPLRPARATIAELEKHSRGLYTGYVGVQNDNQCHIYVNLRCIQCFDDALVAYTGGGITFESDPADEWRETREKLHALLNNFIQIPA